MYPTAAQLTAFTLLLHDVRRVSGVDVTLGALAAADADHFVIDKLVGATTDGLLNLRVAVGSGLGGKATLLARPAHVRDYCHADGITHDYDAAVRREGIRAAFAVPVSIPGGPRGLIYGALRREHVFGDRVITDVAALVRALERNLAEALSLNRRLERLQAGAAAMCAEERRRLADICAELGHIASTMEECPQRRQIDALVRRLTADAVGPRTRANLTNREREIIAEVALGLTNREIAAKLGIGAETVKSSLASSMRKLGVPNRAALVAFARG
ncbi:LuxR C-terminal-related transcriptional regulator [Kutzneria sp. NPDC052558]|uniref:helix-turn-helix transcriptional regulator n=1 Tax=Kutzneria sp. NPDC052558 TaxID=3364121 RepID=UPI0037CBD5A9